VSSGRLAARLSALQYREQAPMCRRESNYNEVMRKKDNDFITSFDQVQKLADLTSAIYLVSK
jgi:hypothetical protein